MRVKRETAWTESGQTIQRAEPDSAAGEERMGCSVRRERDQPQQQQQEQQQQEEQQHQQEESAQQQERRQQERQLERKKLVTAKKTTARIPHHQPERATSSQRQTRTHEGQETSTGTRQTRDTVDDREERASRNKTPLASFSWREELVRAGSTSDARKKRREVEALLNTIPFRKESVKCRYCGEKFKRLSSTGRAPRTRLRSHLIGADDFAATCGPLKGLRKFQSDTMLVSAAQMERKRYN